MPTSPLRALGTRYAPHNDEMCQDLPYNRLYYDCTVTYATDGWAYVAFPTVDYCCKCENQFGSTRYDWLQENATYLGSASIRGIPSYGWRKMGKVANDYWASIDGSLSVQFNETWDHVPMAWLFDLSTYDTGPFDDTLVMPPSNCSTLCPSWPCKMYRK